MYPSIAFFPWIEIAEPLTIGDLRLLPYERRLRSSGNLSHVEKQDLDEILGAYSDSKGSLVQRATLLEIGAWESGQVMSDDIYEAMFRAREILAFAGLANRELFGGLRNYVNADHYTLVVQRFQPGQQGFAFSARRRDGNSLNYWTRDQFAFQRPIHAQKGARVEVDSSLVSALLRLPVGDPILEAIQEFNGANTDSKDVAPHVEVVMCKTAFEWLVGLFKAKGLFEALVRWLPEEMTFVQDGPMKQTWLTRWKPKSNRLIVAWAQDFNALRGMSAHANSRKKAVWSHFSHLAFASILFPVLVKITLAERNLYKRTERDLDEAREPLNNSRLAARR